VGPWAALITILLTSFVPAAEAVPFTLVVPRTVTINPTQIDGATGVDIPLWLMLHDDVTFARPDVWSTARFDFQPGDPANWFGAGGTNLFSEFDLAYGTTTTLNLLVGPGGTGLRAGDVLTDGSGVFDHVLQPGQVTMPSSQAGMALQFRIRGWSPALDNTASSSNGVFFQFNFGQHTTGLSFMTVLFDPNAAAFGVSHGVHQMHGLPGGSLPANPTYAPVQVDDATSLSVSIVGIVVLGTLMRRRTLENEERRTKN
jgi:hypothetical protein